MAHSKRVTYREAGVNTADMGEGTGPYHPAHRPVTHGQVRGRLMDGAESAWKGNIGGLCIPCAAIGVRNVHGLRHRYAHGMPRFDGCFAHPPTFPLTLTLACEDLFVHLKAPERSTQALSQAFSRFSLRRRRCPLNTISFQYVMRLSSVYQISRGPLGVCGHPGLGNFNIKKPH